MAACGLSCMFFCLTLLCLGCVSGYFVKPGQQPALPLLVQPQAAVMQDWVLLTAIICDRPDIHHPGMFHAAGSDDFVHQFVQDTQGITGATPVVIDWRDCLANPKPHLRMYTPDEDLTMYDELSPNDFRFILYRYFLRDHPNVKRMFIMDGKDTAIHQNPLPLLQPGTLYVGSDGGQCGQQRVGLGPKWCWPLIQECPMGYLNAGILGGDIDVLQPVLDEVANFLLLCNGNANCEGDAIIDHRNLNMIAVNCVVYKNFINRTAFKLVSGPPIENTEDAWLVHSFK
eukprot:gb/GFBE01030930.1/.p1 GENE.gb/GFBE01030930.1/~~gb/GFBE01030930.1/.p1  ORF type:complete len:285 (+),score=59.94 gb/GFBE01030930.1/:1-855(+)